MAYSSNRLRLLAKRANERMRSLEKKGITSPAYKSAQSRLEMLGVRTRGQTGRRFSETGKFTNKNEARQIETMLEQFLEQRTSTIRGYKNYRKDVLEGARERFGDFEDLGITDEEYLQIWESLPDDESARLYGSDEVVSIVSNVMKRKGETTSRDAYTVPEIINTLQNSRNLKTALGSLGLSSTDYLRDLGEL